MEFPENKINVLYSVSPKEKEGGRCESLTSYIIRLAREHNVLPGILIGKIIAPMLDNNYILNSSINGGNRFYDGAKSLNAFDKNTLGFTRVLGLLTQRNDIEDTTLLEMRGIISPRNLLKNNLTWCPNCVEEWQGNAYYPLIWFFKDVNVCLKHSCELKEACFLCNKDLPILHRKSLIGHCPYCSNWLGASEQKEIKDKKELIKAQSVSWLIENRSFLAQKYSKKSISNVLFQLINYYTNGNLADFARIINIPKVTLWDWVYGGRLPSLGKILDICFILNVPLAQFLNADCQSNFHLDTETKQKKEEKILIRRKINKQELQKKLETLLLKIPSLSLSEVAKILRYDRKVLMANFPEICRLIVNQHKEYCIQQKKYRDSKLGENIDEAVHQLLENEVYPSRREVEKFLGKPGLLHEKKIREKWLKKISE